MIVNTLRRLLDDLRYGEYVLRVELNQDHVVYVHSDLLFALSWLGWMMLVVLSGGSL